MIQVQPNTPPKFLGKLKNQKLWFNETLNYTLPIYKDRENDVFVKAVLKGKSHLPYFISFNEAKRTFKVDPLQQEVLIGLYEIEVVLKESTGYDQTTYFFNITIEDVPFIPDTYMKVTTFDVSNNGTVFMAFDQNLTNWWDINIDKELLLLEIVSEATDTIKFDWVVKDQNMKNWTLQLDFDQPSSIGLFEVADQMTMTILNN